MRNYLKIVVLLVVFATFRTALRDIFEGYNDLNGDAGWIIWPTTVVMIYLVYKLKKRLDFADQYFNSSKKLLDELDDKKRTRTLNDGEI
jgi:biopolymer transport protein ExbB/TolQ